MSEFGKDKGTFEFRYMGHAIKGERTEWCWSAWDDECEGCFPGCAGALTSGVNTTLEEFMVGVVDQLKEYELEREQMDHVRCREVMAE